MPRPPRSCGRAVEPVHDLRGAHVRGAPGASKSMSSGSSPTIRTDLRRSMAFLHARRCDRPPTQADRREAAGRRRLLDAGSARLVPSFVFGHEVPARRAKVEERAAPTGGVAEEAALLPVQHQDLVVVVDGLRVPVRRQLRRAVIGVRRADVHVRPDQAGPLRHAVVVAVDGQRGFPQQREAQHRRAGLRPDAGDRLEPGARLRHRHGRRESRGRGRRGAPVIARRIAWMRGAFSSGQVTPWIVSSTSAVRRVAHGRPVGIARPQGLEGPPGIRRCGSGATGARRRARSTGRGCGSTGSGSRTPAQRRRWMATAFALRSSRA